MSEKITIHYHDTDYLLTQEEYDIYRSKCLSQTEVILKPMIEEFLSGRCEDDDLPLEFDAIVEEAESTISLIIDELLLVYPEIQADDLEPYAEEYKYNEGLITSLMDVYAYRPISTRNHSGDTIDVSEVRERNKKVAISCIENIIDILLEEGVI